MKQSERVKKEAGRNDDQDIKIKNLIELIFAIKRWLCTLSWFGIGIGLIGIPFTLFFDDITTQPTDFGWLEGLGLIGFTLIIAISFVFLVLAKGIKESDNA